MVFLVVLFVLATALDAPSARGVPTARLTDVFAVHLKKGADANAVAAEHGYVNLGRIGLLDDMYRFQRAPVSSNGPARRSAHAKRLDESSEVLLMEQQVARKRFPREFATMNDPFWGRSWNLHDDGVAVNVQRVWTELNITGRGAQVAIVDDGLEHTHDDISPNYNAAGSYDINHHKADPTPYSRDRHGTSAAGCASAAANNGKCSAGTAPRSKVAGIRLIAEATSDADEAEGLSYRIDINDIMSSSWGPYDDGNRLEGPGPVLQAAFKAGVETGRGGKGTIYVWAAGNGRGSNDNCNYDGYANSRYTIPVAAVVSGGRASYYSEPCAAAFCTIPSSGGSRMGISTADLNNQCTNSFGGTSAAAPEMAGVIALMLEANPNLTWRDVQHVIASSATKTGLEQRDWTQNGGGYHHHHDFGFGRIEAYDTVLAAKNWVNVPPSAPEHTTGQVSVNQPITSATTTATVNVVSNITFVEHVTLRFHARSPRRGGVEVILESPSGTQSVLSTPHGDSNTDYPSQGWDFGTVRNWGEVASGTWKVHVKNQRNQGTFTWFELIIYGYIKTAAATSTK